ncbi:MAG TPA: cytochrome d ubiquinol oxidase subunit II [Candidatus Binataceae bacterium]|nr:cytochrome d ubiquinol oxidase subunit II [Candidatus Binataceae bacterium]
MSQLLLIYFVAGVLLVSLTIYVLTAGADYGGGVWDLFATGPRASLQRDLIERAIGPVWEADHVWLILVIVLLFTGFPPAFSAIMIGLHVPLTLIIIGVVMRGSAFSFRSYGGGSDRAERDWGRVFAIASLVTPILLGVALGTIADGRVPAHPTQLADFFLPWLTPFGFAVGFFALVLFAYLAACYAPLETDDPQLQDDFRMRAIIVGILAGIAAGIVLLLSRVQAPLIWGGLTQREWTWPLMWANGLAALGALYALWRRYFSAARVLAAAHVSLILWGWAFAQFPYLVPMNNTIFNSASPKITMEFLSGALAAGSVILLPSYRYLISVFKSHPERRRRTRTVKPISAGDAE